MFNVMVLEDCDSNREVLTAIIKSINGDIRAFSASTVSEAEKLLQNKLHFDLFILDINLSGVTNENDSEDKSGLEFAKRIRGIQEYEFTPIVFATSIASLEIDSYRETQCSKYLIKPYQKGEVISAVRKAFRFREEKDGKQINVKLNGVNYRIKLAEIRYLKAVTRGVEIKLTGETVFAKYYTLKQLLKEIGSDQFVQCHRMFAVNKSYIEYIDIVNGFIKIEQYDEMIEIGVTYKNMMREMSNE